MLRYLIKVASNRGLLAHSKTLTTWLSPSLSSSGRATTFASGPFSASNIERTLKELNEESLRKKLVGDYEADGTARQSSVLIPLCRHEGKPSILFTLRSNRLSRHKGYPCFPGGVFEDGDVDSIHTALRETHEELGLESKYVKVLGTMPRFKVPRDNIEITAVIADIGDIDSHELKINHNEVSLVFSRTVEELTSAENTGVTVFREVQKQVLYATPVFLAGPYKIWGVTAMLLHIFLACLVPDFYKRPIRPVVFRKKYQPKDPTSESN
ncbi:nucleoside diphosphate-linked moiety X motif 8-like isoform X1 [Varroa destructor]|uniref:Nudix hydrolase domain-containing protein n=1 Tax=Varroa destructor TaxID=109461 RepID=A0A7M7KW80_VARDE|nr:nucleoside diphosphate-linked moiety X motif 8-like isoform X1 [Varroa destructor]XP_022671652.1 nucleoside diphosphate-linked moiety X motif 8-like isoform X1 [Varroa destructor]